MVPPGHVVTIDGVPAGVGALWRRLPPGRHLVEARGRDGRAASQWVELDGATADRPVALAQAEPALAAIGTATARRQRLVELSRALDQEQLRGCVRSLAKQGLADGTHVELEVGVQASGAIRYLNIVDTDLPAIVIETGWPDPGYDSATDSSPGEPLCGELRVVTEATRSGRVFIT